jgi:hypothetical protein
LCSWSFVAGLACVAEPSPDDEGGQSPTTAGEPETDTVVSTDTDTETDTDTDTDSGPAPAECGMPDPDVDALFELTLVDWPEDDDDYYAFVEDCTVDAVAVDEGESVTITSLTCQEGLVATLRTALSDAGAVAWTAGDLVRVDAHRSYSKGGYPAPARFEMRLASDDSLLAAVTSDESDDAAQTGFPPLAVVIDSPCAAEDGSWDPVSLRVAFSGPGGESLALFDQQRGVLTIDDARFAIDVGAATTNNCCHTIRDVDLLVQRVL